MENGGQIWYPKVTRKKKKRREDCGEQQKIFFPRKRGSDRIRGKEASRMWGEKGGGVRKTTGGQGNEGGGKCRIPNGKKGSFQATCNSGAKRKDQVGEKATGNKKNRAGEKNSAP